MPHSTRPSPSQSTRNAGRRSPRVRRRGLTEYGRDIDFETVASELLRALRGHRSQVQFSRRLGYSSNMSAEWESGRRYPSARTMFCAAERVGVSLDEALGHFDPKSAGFFTSESRVSAWLSSFRGDRSLEELAASTGYTRHQVGRWLTGKSRMRLPCFLALLQGLTGRLPRFVSLLVPIDRVPSLASEFTRRQQLRQIAQDNPWASAVLMLLGTQQYAALNRHDDQWLAQRLGTDEATLEQCMSILRREGLVQMASGGKYRLTSKTQIDLNTAPLERKRHLAHAALSRRPHRDGDTRVDIHFYAVDRSEQQRIDALTDRYLRDLAAIGTSSGTPEATGIIAVHTTRLTDPAISVS